MEPRRHGARKLSLYSRAYSTIGLYHPLHAMVDIYSEVFSRHHSRFIQLQIQNTTLAPRLQAVFDVMVKCAFSRDDGGI